ncbi:MAG: glucokinase [Desulfobulbaceae bacterium]|nr:glucokinase [Desulfobulbaceae bacterium]
MTQPSERGYLLAGDIGGTKTTLALYDAQEGLRSSLAETTVQNKTVTSLEKIIEPFLRQQKVKPDFACFGVAGPVAGNRVQMTNLDWTMDGFALQQQFNMKSVTLINDLVATGMGAVILPDECFHTINTGRPDNEGAIAIIAPGTGLGEAFVVRNRNSILPFPSEGGHCSFAPVNSLQTRLLVFMFNRQDHVSTEHVCSGMGIPNLYDFLLSEQGGQNKIKKLPAAGDRTKAIVQTALAAEPQDPGNRVVMETLELFVAILASEAANLTLKVLGTGGLYIGGGIPPRILPFLQRDVFMQDFCKGVYRDMLAEIPVRVILEPKTALIGAAAYALAANLPGDMP